VVEAVAVELEGMPEPRRLRRRVVDGSCVIEHGSQVLFCYDQADTGMRNLAVVALTQGKVAVKDAAVLFGLTPEYVSQLRGRARKEGSAGLVKTMGRPPKLTARQVRQVRELAGQGASKSELARRFKVTRPVILEIINRHGVIPAEPQLPCPADQDELAGQGSGGGVEAAGSVAPHSVSGGSGSQVGSLPERVELGSARVGTGSLSCRYAGAMLVHAFFTRVGAEQVFASLQAARAEAGNPLVGAGGGPVLFDDVALTCAVTLAFGLGISSVEGAKHSDRAGAGALAGLVALPELRTLRSRLG
jgi:hypothetical protein